MLGRNGLSWGRDDVKRLRIIQSKRWKGTCEVFFLGDSFGYASSDDISWSWLIQSTQSDIWWMIPQVVVITSELMSQAPLGMVIRNRLNKCGVMMICMNMV